MDPEAAQRPVLDPLKPVPEGVVNAGVEPGEFHRQLAPQVTEANDGQIVTPPQTQPQFEQPIHESVNQAAAALIPYQPMEGHYKLKGLAAFWAKFIQFFKRESEGNYVADEVNVGKMHLMRRAEKSESTI